MSFSGTAAVGSQMIVAASRLIDALDVEQAAVAQVLEQGRQAAVELGQLGAHGLEVLLVRVPAAVVDGHVGDALLDQP